MGVATTNSAPAGFRPVESVAASVTRTSQESRMLHVSPRSGQARRTRRWAGWIASAMVLFACAAPIAHAQQTAPTLAQADALARDGQHLAAAARYEQLARRGFMTWDATTALLAAREYVLGGAAGDAQRLLDKVRNRIKTDDERALFAEVDARVALERGDAARALGLLRSLPQPWPADMAPDLLALRGRAEITSGDALGGVRTFEERAALLVSPAARAENDRLLFDQLLQRPPGALTSPGMSERERGWLELPAIVTAGGNDSAHAATVAAWMSQHPGHPGTAFIPDCTRRATRFRDDRQRTRDDHRLAAAAVGQAAAGRRRRARRLCRGLVRVVVGRCPAAGRRCMTRPRSAPRRRISVRSRQAPGWS